MKYEQVSWKQRHQVVISCYQLAQKLLPLNKLLATPTIGQFFQIMNEVLIVLITVLQIKGRLCFYLVNKGA